LSTQTVILGAGVTGMAAGFASGADIYEAKDIPGGICTSYYMKCGQTQKLYQAPLDQEAYRFELGGGHWIFGNDPLIQHFLESFAPVETYARHSGVFFPTTKQYVGYPIQHHLKDLPTQTATQALQEIIHAQIYPKPNLTTMADWLEQSFGQTLGQLFFYPFHNLYTAGLWRKISPQDAYKSPIDLPLVIQGAFQNAAPIGYNATFVYPIHGLDSLIGPLAKQCRIHYGKTVIRIDPQAKEITFQDGTVISYQTILSTLPLNQLIQITHISLEQPDPGTSVLVLNVAGKKGKQTPAHHWLYIPESKAGFHRVGFYSNVDAHFLPKSKRLDSQYVSMYIEKAYPETTKWKDLDLESLKLQIITELQEWGWLETVEVSDFTWIDVAYTWSWPKSQWRSHAIQQLQKFNIFPIGRHGRWNFQGIADSIRDGLMAGAAVKAKR